VPVNCVRCRSMIPQADITARMTAKDKEGNFFCARCTVDLASQMGVKLGGPGPKGNLPPAGLPGQTVILSRTALTRPGGGGTARVETVTHPGSAPRPGSGPRVGTGARPGSSPRVGTGSGVRPAASGSGVRPAAAAGRGTEARPATQGVPRPATRVVTTPGGRTPTRVVAPARAGSSGRVPTLRPAPGRAGSSGRVPTAVAGRTTRRMPPPPVPEEVEAGYEGEMEEGAPPARRRPAMSPKMLALVSLGVVAVLAVVFFFVMSGRTGVNRERDGRYREAKKALEDYEACVRDRPRELEQQLQLAKAFAEKAKGVAQFEKAAPALVTKAEEAIKQVQESKKAAVELDSLEKDVEDKNNADRVFKDLERIKTKIDLTNAELVSRFEIVYKKAAQTRVTTLFNDAKTLAEKEPNSFDAILAKLDEAHEAAVKAGGPMNYIINEILDEIDRVSNLRYTAEFEDKIPWADLLTAEWRDQWKKSSPLDNLDVQAAGAEWTLTAKDASGSALSIYFIGKDKGWRDAVVDMEFVIEKKGFSFFGRCGRSESVVRYDVTASDKTGMKEGETYKMKIFFKGQKGKADLTDVGTEPFNIPYSVATTGGVGLALEPGAKVRLKAFKIRVLRAQTK
jgi:hypothetical protein